MSKLEARYHLSQARFPWYVGFVNQNSVTANLIAYAKAPGYEELDHTSLVRSLASRLFAGGGPHSFYMKAREAGLVYGNWLTNDPAAKMMWYYADRSPDVPSLVSLVNSIAAATPDLHDPLLVDYALRQSFPDPRATWTPAQRGWAIARDIRDGNTPQKVRRFSEAILRLRREPNLLSQLTREARNSIGSLLLSEDCRAQQSTSQSVFFLIGSEKILSDIEHRLPMPRLLRVWPGDYWINGH
jgi:hypothetical protein